MTGHSARSSVGLVQRVAALCLIVLLSPLLVLITGILTVVNGWPPLFVQTRAGHLGRPFDLVKFRTMTGDVGPDGELLPDAERLTWLGRLLRSTSLDELPELWNVLRGEMAFVGPRPLFCEYTRHFTPRQARRLEVPPGITGWAQVNGRNALDWDARLELDVWYVEHRTPWIDAVVLYRTIPVVFGRRNVSREGHATMERFDEQE